MCSLLPPVGSWRTSVPSSAHYQLLYVYVNIVCFLYLKIFFVSRTMSLVTFQSLYKYGHCSQFLEDLLSEDIQNDNLMTIVTEAGSVSVSRRVMQLLSPLLGSMLTGLPGSGAREGEVVTVIVPDTDTTAVSKMMELLINGEANIDDEESQEGILSLAECLGVRIHNLETFSNCKKESYEVGQSIEVFISGSNINNNAGAQKDVIEMKLEDSCGDHIHTEDEGDNDITGVKSEESSAVDDESIEFSAPYFPDPVPLRKSIKSKKMMSISCFMASEKKLLIV